MAWAESRKREQPSGKGWAEFNPAPAGQEPSKNSPPNQSSKEEGPIISIKVLTNLLKTHGLNLGQESFEVRILNKRQRIKGRVRLGLNQDGALIIRKVIVLTGNNLGALEQDLKCARMKVKTETTLTAADPMAGCWPSA